MTQSFIKVLQEKRSQYNNADQVRTQAESLKQLSSGIYTEEERFIYELLQNAVDAFVDTTNTFLDVKIEMRENTLCFMHNGAAFSQRDIEGLCDVGRSNKSSSEIKSNKRKVGYKGIGFKSVFMQSVESVCVKSGEYCFKFDKLACKDIMPNFPGEDLSPDDLPWQIIPIECDSQQGIDTTGYNVATYIKGSTNKSLVTKILSLLKNPQFLLFLNADNIRIRLIDNGSELIVASRTKFGEETHLMCDDRVVSRWLVHTSEPIAVNENIREYLIRDFNTPQKLKEATHFELSFAISLNEKGEFVPVEESVVYTFLPTSYMNIGTPFLVNANFITDAGRQQLHQTSEWNRLIFKSLPDCFFRWIATLSPKHNDYSKILPRKFTKSFDELTKIYSEALLETIDNIPFIPRLKDGKLLKVSEAIIDRVNLSDTIGKELLVKHINSHNTRKYKADDYVSQDSTSVLESYGVYVFDQTSLLQFLSDDDSLSEIDLKKDKQLIEYLYDYTNKSDFNFAELLSLLPVAKIIYDDSNRLNKASELFFLSLNEEFDVEKGNVNYINGYLYENLSKKIILWLKKTIGIKELNKRTIVEHILFHPDKITVDNAIEIGRFLFASWKKGDFLEIVGDANIIRSLPFLTKSGKLEAISNLYLSTAYSPEDDLEPLYDDIDYISTDYVNGSNWEEWAYFLKKCGIRFNLGVTANVFHSGTVEGEKYKEKYAFLRSAACSLRDKDHSRKWHCGYSNPIENIGFCLYYFSYVSPDKPNYELYKFVFSRILSKRFDAKSIDDRIFGKIHYWGTKVDDKLNDHIPHTVSSKYASFLEYVIANEQLFPTLDGGLTLAQNTFLNTPAIQQYAGSYLPVIDIDSQVDESWLGILPFKKELALDDYLSVLSSISEHPSDNNKERINSIYKKLIELGYENSNTITEWGKTHTLLSASEDSFLSPSELSFITVDGFKSKSKIYVGKYERSTFSSMICLLKSFGVTIITQDNIRPQFSNSRLSGKLKELLIEKVDAITLLKGQIKDNSTFELEKRAMINKINNCEFFQCSSIRLSYGNDDDVIEKATYSYHNQFYYVGSLKPTKIGPLTEPLSRLLDLKDVNKEFFMILITESKEEIIEYLQDEGYDTGLIKTDKSMGSNEEPLTTKDIPRIDTYDETIEIEIEKEIRKEKTEGDTDSAFAHNNVDNTPNHLRQEWENPIKNLLGDGFQLPENDVKCENLITRWRVYNYVKKHSSYTIDSSFDGEQLKAYIEGETTVIPLADNRKLIAQGAKGGIWYISPNVWRGFDNEEVIVCLCTGNGDNDFSFAETIGDIENYANTKNVLIKVSPSNEHTMMDSISSIFPGDDNYQMNIHLMVRVHKTGNEVDNIFDKSFDNPVDDFKF